jgi:hypothetical protein
MAGMSTVYFPWITSGKRTARLELCLPTHVLHRLGLHKHSDYQFEKKFDIITL